MNVKNLKRFFRQEIENIQYVENESTVVDSVVVDIIHRLTKAQEVRK